MSEIIVSLFHIRDGRTAQSRLKEAIDDFSREHRVEFSQGEILYAENGKPYLEGRNVEISISHSGELWGCALSKEPVGLDIQLVREKGIRSVAKRFFHPEEYRYLQETGFTDFFAVWTAKESYVKFTGEGITDDFSAFCVVDSQGLLRSVNGAEIKLIPFLPEYRICICSKRISGLIIKDKTSERCTHTPGKNSPSGELCR